MPLGDGIRRDISRVSSLERDRFIAAIVKLDTTKFYPDGVSYWDKQEDIHKNAHFAGVDVHNGSAFIPWHRVIVNRLEQLLREVDPELSLHYWDWTTDPRSTVGGRAALFTPQFMGNSNGNAGHLLDAFESTEGNGHDKIWREVGLNTSVIKSNKTPKIDSYAEILASGTNFATFSDKLKKAHDLVAHSYIGGTIKDAHYSFHDPFVFLLHSNLDRLWAKWQTDPAHPERIAVSTAYISLTSAELTSLATENVEPWAGGTGLKPWASDPALRTLVNYMHTSVVVPAVYEHPGPIRALSGAPVAMFKQIDVVLTALIVENEGSMTVSWVEGTDNWQGPDPISEPVFARETHIVMFKQTDDVLTALAVDKDGALNVIWIEGTGLWQGPNKISAADTFRKGAPVAMCKQTDDTLTALAINKSGVLNASWIDGTGLWQGPVPIGVAHQYATDKETHVAMCKQTDDTLAAMAVDMEGALTVAWVDGSGLWQGPKVVGPFGRFSKGAPVAMCKQTDDVLTALAVDTDGAMNVIWIEGTGLWQGPNKISPPVFRAEETHVAMCKQNDDTLTALAVDKDGALTMLWVDGTGAWQGPARISSINIFRPGAHVDMCKQTDDVLTALAVDDTHAALNVSWVEGTSLWQGPQQIWP